VHKPKYNGDRLYGTRRVLPVLFLRKHYLDQVKGPGGRPSQPYSAPLYFDAPNHNATVQPKQEKKYGMRVRCMGTHAVFLFEKLPTLICDA
jgi:hypothetical protein